MLSATILFGALILDDILIFLVLLCFRENKIKLFIW